MKRSIGLFTALLGTALPVASPLKAQQEQTSILIDNASYWTAGMNAASGPMDILIEGNAIKFIAPEITAPEGAEVIDAKGKTLIPGLIDTHVHIMDTLSPNELKDTDLFYLAFLAEQNAERVLMNGVTTIREAAGP